MSSVLLVAQFFGIMPVIGITNPVPMKLHFKWCCFRTFYTIIVFVQLFGYAVLTFYWVICIGFNVDKLGAIMFTGMNTIILVCFLILAKKWPNLMMLWWEVEQKLPPFSQKKESFVLKKKITIVAIIIGILSSIEHILSIVSGLYYPSHCPPREDPVRDFFRSHLQQLFYFTEYSAVKAVFGKIISILGTFIWSYIDLFVMLISIGLATRFQQLNDCLHFIKGQTISQEFWSEQRVNFRNLCFLCETVDNTIAIITLLSFSNNLYFICFQLLNSLK